MNILDYLDNDKNTISPVCRRMRLDSLSYQDLPGSFFEDTSITHSKSESYLDSPNSKKKTIQKESGLKLVAMVTSVCLAWQTRENLHIMLEFALQI